MSDKNLNEFISERQNTVKSIEAELKNEVISFRKNSLKNWKSNCNRTRINSRHIVFLSYFKSWGEEKSLTQDLKRHFSSPKSIQRVLLKLINEINEYQTGILFLKVTGELTSGVKPFHKITKPFFYENGSRVLEFTDADLDSLKNKFMSIISNL